MAGEHVPDRVLAHQRVVDGEVVHAGDAEDVAHALGASASTTHWPPVRRSVTEWLAPRVGLEPTTLRLTAGCSTIELSGSDDRRIQSGPFIYHTLAIRPSHGRGLERAPSIRIFPRHRGLKLHPIFPRRLPGPLVETQPGPRRTVDPVVIPCVQELDGEPRAHHHQPRPEEHALNDLGVHESGYPISFRPSRAFDSVTWSAYSRSPPTGRPRAMRVIRSRRAGCRSLAR